jgi:hypothetical protein
LVAIVSSRIIRITILLALYQSLSSMGVELLAADILITALLVSVVLTFAALVGLWWARRTREWFLLVRLFRRLKPTDRAATLELLR